jgi:putative membrane protein insertion efficiency factor
LLAGAITAYQQLISPWLGPRCRFTPSCSEYAREAILVRGPVVGLALAIFRLLRCQPLCAGGYDPVPLPRAARAARSVSDSSEDGTSKDGVTQDGITKDSITKDSEPTDAADASAEGAPAC